jgi:cellulose synthase/poly-beta-1,6-N-acetylglucosamine synthase-like glycosyltransferase
MALTDALRWLLLAAEIALALPIAYLAVITCAALIAQARRRRRLFAPPTNPPTFAVLIPAHNEEALIGSSLASLAGLRYPRERYAICVVADNCTDATAAIARAADAVVFERHDTSKRGKGYALNWLLAELARRGQQYDAYVVVDADSVVAPDFLLAMAGELARGARACQASNTVLNTNEAPSAALRWLAMTLMNHVRPLGRNAIGGSSNLSGNGMCLSRDLLARFPWRAFGLTEDYQYYLDIVAGGECVRYVPEAVVRSHMPTSFEQMRTQDVRWESGAPEASHGRMAWRLLAAGVRRHSIAPFDAVAELLVPPLSTLAAALLIVLLGAALIGTTGERLLAGVLLVGFALYVASAFIMLRPGWTTYRALLYAPGYMAWKLWVQLVLKRREQKRGEWMRTRRPEAEAGEWSDGGTASRSLVGNAKTQGEE